MIQLSSACRYHELLIGFRHATMARQTYLELIELEDTVDILDVLSEVDIGANELSIAVVELGPEDGDLAITLDGKVNVLGALGEVLAVPLELA